MLLLVSCAELLFCAFWRALCVRNAFGGFPVAICVCIQGMLLAAFRLRFVCAFKECFWRLSGCDLCVHSRNAFGGFPVALSSLRLCVYVLRLFKRTVCGLRFLKERRFCCILK
jgi:hypothetical protein